MFRKNNFTTSEDVYVNCLRTHNTSIVNKDLVKTYQSNAMRIGQKLASTNLGGTTNFEQQITDTTTNTTTNITTNITTTTTNNNPTPITKCNKNKNKNKF